MRYSKAPWVSACLTVSSEAYAVIITTSIEGSARLLGWQRERPPGVELVAGLPGRPMAAHGLDETLADGRAHLDQAFPNHLPGVEGAVEVLGRHPRRAPAGQEPDPLSVLPLGV